MKLLLIASVLMLACPALLAHPEDEFCTADSGLDPALCRALAEADKSSDDEASAGPGAMLDAEQRARVRRNIEFERPW